MLVNRLIDNLNSLNIPPALRELLIANSFDRERLLEMNIDDLAVILNIDIEAAKIISNSVTNYSGLTVHNMRELT
jgi:hypothetical protein